ncbi:MAG TPA: hypothetical protein DEA44_12230, partial [Firmicutes bacterium]|nr:hypothetical protein [Bacillota bacterium]
LATYHWMPKAVELAPIFTVMGRTVCGALSACFVQPALNNTKLHNNMLKTNIALFFFVTTVYSFPSLKLLFITLGSSMGKRVISRRNGFL